MNKQMVENLPKSRLKHSLVDKRSFDSKLIGNDNEGKWEQLVVSIVTMKKQCMQENTKWEKAKRWTKWVEPRYL